MLIALGYEATRKGFFPEEANVYLSKFVFYFVLSAMLDWSFVLAYLSATMVVYLIATFVALRRGVPSTEAAVEAQCAAGGV